jgi:hypothetical protein
MTNKDFYITLANYQDNLLQNYRLIFISSQTIVISIATLIVSITPNKWIIFPLLFIGLILLYLWYSISKHRGFDVSYCHMQLIKIENNETLTQDENNKPFVVFKKWQKSKDKEEILSNFDKEHDIKLLDSPSRKSLGLYLPLIYFIMWAFLLLYVII